MYKNNHSGVRFVKIFLINGESRWTYRPDLRNEEAEPSDVVASKDEQMIPKTLLMH